MAAPFTVVVYALASLLGGILEIMRPLPRRIRRSIVAGPTSATSETLVQATVSLALGEHHLVGHQHSWHGSVNVLVLQCTRRGLLD
jgi:hypothetical protein